MTWAERGLYRELLDESFLRDGLPAEPEQIAALLAEPLEKIKPELDVVLHCFGGRETPQFDNRTRAGAAK